MTTVADKKVYGAPYRFHTGVCRTFTTLVFVLSLQACALPGFNVDSYVRSVQNEKANKPHILGYEPVVEQAPDLEVPAGAVTQITPALVRSQSSNRNNDVPKDIAALLGRAPRYTIGPGDVVGIIVYDHPELLPNAGAVISQAADPTGISVAPGFIVGPTGEVSFPYAGRLKLDGLTEIEAAELVTNRIAKYIRSPQVTVRIASFRSRRAYVEGEVRTPGLQIFTDVPMTLAEALNRAGGITQDGDRSFVTLGRAGATIEINLMDLQRLGVMSSDIPLKNGDVVTVRNLNERKVYVMGEVLRPSALVMKNGMLTLNDALGEAGGVNLATSDPSQIYVIRNSAGHSPLIYHLDAKNPAALALADRFNLAPKDVVYVDYVPLVQWSRLVSLILPAASVVNTGSAVISR